MPVADTRVSISKFGARGSIAVSSLLPSDAEQMLRVHLSLRQPLDHTNTPLIYLSSLRGEAAFMPS